MIRKINNLTVIDEMVGNFLRFDDGLHFGRADAAWRDAGENAQ